MQIPFISKQNPTVIYQETYTLDTPKSLSSLDEAFHNKCVSYIFSIPIISDNQDQESLNEMFRNVYLSRTENRMYLTNAAILFISKVSGLWGQILKRPQVRPEEVKSLFVSQSDENPYPGPDLNDEYAIISSHGMMCLDFPGYTIIKHLYTGKRNDINMLVTKIKADPFEKILEEAQRRGLTVKVLTPKDLNAQYKIEKRTRYIQVRLNDYELMIIEKKAKENGMNKSEYLRKVALGELVP